jgi:outer membrane immunogenic protein
MKWKCVLLLSGAALVALASSASAADIPSRVAPVAPIPYAYNWTGFYLGINGGWGWGESRFRGPPSTGRLESSGGLVGGTAGYNWQVNQIVWGAEGDIDWADIRPDGRCRGGAICEARSEWLSTIRGRIGYAAWDRFLPYITGGLALGDVSARVTGFPGHSSDTRAGFAVGGGVEYAFYGQWTAKVEYLFVDLGHTACGTRCGTLGPDHVEFKENIVRGGLNYRF